MELYPFQKNILTQAVGLYHNYSKFFYNAGDVGTGKTRTSIYTIGSIRESERSHILCVTNGATRTNWGREILEFDEYATEDNVTILYSSSDYKYITPITRWVVCSYNLIISAAVQVKLLAWGIDYLIYDEAQKLKNPQARCTKVCLALSDLPSVKFNLWLSGTPVKKTLLDMYPFLSRAIPICSDYYEYAEAFCEKKKHNYNYKGFEYDGGINIDKWRKMVKPVFKRVRKEEVLTELPELTYQRVFFKGDVTLTKEANELAKEYKYVTKKDGEEIVLPPNFSDVRMRLYYAKHLEFKEYVETLLDQDIPLILVYYHTACSELARKEFHKYRPLYINGTTPSKKRQEICDHFNKNEDSKLLIGQIQSMGVGLNLQHKCSNIIFAEMSFSPDDILQACGRISRIGQTKPCTAHITILADTYEEKIWATNIKKMKLMDKAIENGK